MGGIAAILMSMPKSTAISKRPPAYSRKDPKERRRLLIAAAIDCLAEDGLSGFTVERIAKRAGISKGLISHHFAGKDDLLAHAYQSMTAHLDDIAARHFANGDVSAKSALAAYIDANFEPSAFNRTQLRAWLAVWSETARNPQLAKIHRERYLRFHIQLEQLIANAARESGKSVEPTSLATLLISLVDGLWLEWCLDDNLVSAEDARQTLRALLRPYLGCLD